MSDKKHTFNVRFLAWAMCPYCGMLALNNDKSRKEMRKNCKGKDDEAA